MQNALASFKIPLLLLAAVVVLSFIFAKAIFYNRPYRDVNNNETTTEIVEIPKGATFEQITDSLLANDIIESRFSWVMAARLRGVDNRLKAGSYEIPTQISNSQLLDLLNEGRQRVIPVSFPEGIGRVDVARIIESRLGHPASEVLRHISDSALCRQFGIDDTTLFGYLLPETYHFPTHATAVDVLGTMIKHFQNVLDSAGMARADSLGMSFRDVLTLASIIEAETNNDEERSKISAVYHNRLKKGMRLQADPTVQFIVKGPPRRLYYADLEIDNPYNTYVYTGLPPGPINNPGKASLRAALHPARVSYLFFVSDGVNRHYFSTTYAEHLKARRELDRLRRELRRP